MYQTPRARKPTASTDRTPSRNRSEPGELLALEAQLSKQMRQTESKHDLLKKQHEKINKKFNELQAETRAYKASLEAAEKDLSSTKKMLAKVVQQRSELEAQVQEVKNYARKLEAHIATGSKGQHVSEVNAQLRDQVAGLKRELQMLTKDKEELTEACEERDVQVKVLSRALDIKADELGLRGDMRAAVLYDLGQARMEMERAFESRNKLEVECRRLGADLSEALTSVEELKLIRQANNEVLNSLESEVLELKKERQAQREQTRNLEDENKSLLEYIDELTQKVRTAEDKHAKSEEAVSQLKVSFKNKKDDSIEWQVRLEEMTIRCEQAERQVAELEEELAGVNQQVQQLLVLEKKAKNDVTSELDIREEAEAEAEELKSVVKELSEELVKEREKQRRLEAEYNNRLNRVESQLEEVQNAAAATEEVLKLKLERALGDIEELVEERENMREAMNEAISQCAATMISQQTEKKRNPQESQAKRNLGTLSAENERLRQLIASERRKSEELLGL